MSTLLWIMLVWFVVFAVALTVAVVTLRRANRVVPGVRCQAPVTWLYSPSRPARMHRQLRSLGMWVTHPPPVVHQQLWSDLTAEIVTTDADLVVAARSNTRIRSGELDGVAARIVRLEDLAGRLRDLERFGSPSGQRRPPSDALEVLEHRLGSLEQAHADLVDLERQFGDSRRQPAEDNVDGPSRHTPA